MSLPPLWDFARPKKKKKKCDNGNLKGARTALIAQESKEVIYCQEIALHQAVLSDYFMSQRDCSVWHKALYHCHFLFLALFFLDCLNRQSLFQLSLQVLLFILTVCLCDSPSSIGANKVWADNVSTFHLHFAMYRMSINRFCMYETSRWFKSQDWGREIIECDAAEHICILSLHVHSIISSMSVLSEVTERMQRVWACARASVFCLPPWT